MRIFSKKQTEERVLPRHIAIIMDGNGRWAKKRNLPRTAGHAAGSKTFKDIARYCNKIGIEYLTVYALSMVIAWIQIVAGILLMLKPVSRKLSTWGGAMAMLIFLAGILVFFTSGLVWQTGYGFPELSRAGHAFLKDFILFGAAAWCFSDAL